MKDLRTDLLDKLTPKKQRAFTRWCALRVADKWDAPHTMRRYLETGDEALRQGAYDEWSTWADAHTEWDDARDAAWAAWAAVSNVDISCSSIDSAYSALRATDNPDAERDAQNDKLVEMMEVCE